MSWGLVVVGVGTAVAGVAGSNAAGKAADKQAAAAGDANALQYQMYQQTRDDQHDWRNAGQQAIRQLNMGIGGGYTPAQTAENFDSAAYLAANPVVANHPDWANRAYEHYVQYGKDEGKKFTYTPEAQAQMQQGTGAGTGQFNQKFTLADFEKDPGYDFRLNQGLDAVQGSRAARGSMLSGSALKALQNYGSDYASSEYGKAYDRFNNDQTTRFNRLATIAGIGQTANNNVGTAGMNYGNQAAGNIIGAGNAAAAGTVGQANALTGAVNSMGSLYQLSQLNKTPGVSGYYGAAGSPYGGAQNYTGAGSTGSGVGNAGAGNYAAYYGG